jgi:hypothetical protein
MPAFRDTLTRAVPMQSAVFVFRFAARVSRWLRLRNRLRILVRVRNKNRRSVTMLPYLNESRVPELGPLPEPLRRVLVKRALVLMRSEARFLSLLPTLLCVVGGLAGWLCGGVLLGIAAQLGCVPRVTPLTSTSVLLGMVCGAFGVGAVGLPAGFIGILVQRSRLRPYLQRALEEYVPKPA